MKVNRNLLAWSLSWRRHFVVYLLETDKRYGHWGFCGMVCRCVLEVYLPYVTAPYPWAGCFFCFLDALWLPIGSKWLQAFVKEELILLSMCRHGNHLQESCFCVFRRRLFVLLGDTGRSRWQVASRCRREQQYSSDIELHFSLPPVFHLLMPFFSSSDSSWMSMWKNCYTFYTEKSTESIWGFLMCVFNLQ